MGYLHIQTDRDIVLPFLPLDIDLRNGEGYYQDKKIISFLPLWGNNAQAWASLKKLRIIRTSKNYDPLNDALLGKVRSDEEISAPYEIFEIIAEIDGNIPDKTELTLEINLGVLRFFLLDKITVLPRAEMIRSRTVQVRKPQDINIVTILPLVEKISEEKLSKLITQSIGCVFNDTLSEEFCGVSGDDASEKYECSTENKESRCTFNITAPLGKKLTIKSSCGGYQYITMGEKNNIAVFDCAPKEIIDEKVILIEESIRDVSKTEDI